MRKKLYIDIDGVILGKKDPSSCEVVLANHTKEFLEFCLPRFSCYWLSTHCKEGNADGVLKLLRPYATKEIMDLFKQIAPSKWKTLKTEAIDLSSDFLWIDDQPLACEKDLLAKAGVIDRWILVNTRKNPDELLMVLSELRAIS